MIWKPEEKELTEEEAVSLAKKELMPFWCGDSPLLIAIEAEGKSVLYPLSPEFLKKTWVFMVVDPTTYWGESIRFYAKEWVRRYSLLGVGVVLVNASYYDYLNSPSWLRDTISEGQTGYIQVFDIHGAIAKAFQASAFPKVVIVSEGKILQEASGPQWMDVIEPWFQVYLRGKDPGLPLLPPFKKNKSLTEDCARVEFGFYPEIGTTFRLGNGRFEIGEKGQRRGRFSFSSEMSLEDGVVYLSGQWQQEKDRIWTNDSSAEMRFKTLGRSVGLIAQPIVTPDVKENPYVCVEVNRLAPYDEIRSPQLRVLENSEIANYIVRPNFYPMLQSLSKNDSEITFKFLNARLAPLALYGLRFATGE